MVDTPLFHSTPLIESAPLTAYTSGRVWLKLETAQPTGSFKLRGISHACYHHSQQGVSHLIASSGGNAGLAVAYSARQLGLRATVVVPQTTSVHAIQLLRAEGAQVHIHGQSWTDAHCHALLRVHDDTNSAYIHPFDDPLLWQGHATMIDEIAETGLTPDAIVLSVGGV